MSLINRLSAVFLTIILGVTVTSSSGQANPAKTYGNLYNASYVKSIDGQTIIFDITGVHPLLGDNIAVRLRGLEVPEITGRCQKEMKLAREARDIVHWLLQGARTIILKDVGRDTLFRLTAIVLVDGKDIRNVLLKKGLAVKHNTAQARKDWCQ